MKKCHFLKGLVFSLNTTKMNKIFKKCARYTEGMLSVNMAKYWNMKTVFTSLAQIAAIFHHPSYSRKCIWLQEYSFQITLRQQWNDGRLSFRDKLYGMEGKILLNKVLSITSQHFLCQTFSFFPFFLFPEKKSYISSHCSAKKYEYELQYINLRSRGQCTVCKSKERDTAWH